MIKILLGGSPCTHWSIAQTKNRETTAEGIGWELFKNYLIAKEKFKPDYFLYENNKSASQPIKDQIAKELGVGEDENTRFTYINSSLVSAQNRQRFYVTNFGDIEQPEDRGILLKDVLDSSDCIALSDKAHTVISSCGRTTEREYFKKHQGDMCAEKFPINTYNDDGEKARTLMAGYYKYGTATLITNEGFKGGTTAIAEPCAVGYRGRMSEDGKWEKQYEAREDKKSNALTTAQTDSMVAEPLSDEYYKGGFDTNLIGMIEKGEGKYRNGSQPSQQYRVYSAEGKSQTVNTSANENYIVPTNTGECKTVQQAIPKLADKLGYVPEMFNAYNCAELKDKSPTLSTGSMITSSCAVNKFESVGLPLDEHNELHTKEKVYEVKDGKITIKDKQYPIKLPDGFYIIRKLSVNECKRLQTVPDWYVFPVSNSQAYKMLGNGWTVEVIKHLLSHIPNIENEEIEVLSMYDGMSCGQIALKEMGCNVVKYYATEIDKYAVKTTQENFPDTIQLGDAFQVRNEDWSLE